MHFYQSFKAVNTQNHYVYPCLRGRILGLCGYHDLKTQFYVCSIIQSDEREVSSPHLLINNKWCLALIID